MDLLWLWIPLLGALAMAELVRAQPIHQDTMLNPKDVKLADVCLHTPPLI